MMLMPKPVRVSLCTIIYLLFIHYYSSALNIITDQISVSGISSGADMAVNLIVAYSGTFRGAGIFAGQAYRCAVMRFPKDELVPMDQAGQSVPVCDGCPSGKTLTYDHCKRHPEWVDRKKLVSYAREASTNGTIDSLTLLKTKKIFLYRGTQDNTYKKGSVLTTLDTFKEIGVHSENIYFHNTTESPHLLPGVDPYLCWWEEWSGPDNCTFDGAGEMLSWIHGKESLASGRSNNSPNRLLDFMQEINQTHFFPKYGDPLLADTALAFVPPSCAAGKPCSLHVFLHGCGVTPTYSVFSEFGGFNEWAYLNNFVILCEYELFLYNLTVSNDSSRILDPKMSTRGSTKQEADGCWDGYGQTGADYTLKNSIQMSTIIKIIQGLQEEE